MQFGGLDHHFPWDFHGISVKFPSDMFDDHTSEPMSLGILMDVRSSIQAQRKTEGRGHGSANEFEQGFCTEIVRLNM